MIFIVKCLSFKLKSCSVKTFISNSKMIAVFLAMTILFQSCGSYSSTYMFKKVTLETITQQKKPAKLVKYNNAVLKYRQIEFIEGQYYGIRRVSGEVTREIIIEQEIKTIKMGPKPLSTPAVIGILVVSAALGYVVIQNAIGDAILSSNE